MEMNRLNVQDFTDCPEELQQDIILKYFELFNRGKGVLGIENIPKIVEAGFVTICLNGECELMIDDVVYNFKAGQMCIGFTTTIIQTLWMSPDLECVSLATNIEVLRNMNIPSVSDQFVTIRKNPCISLSSEEIVALPAYFKHIQSVYNRKEHIYRMEMTKQLLLVLCYDIAAIYQRENASRRQVYSYKDSIFRSFLRLLSSNHHRERRVSYYAQELCITPKYLSSVIKDVSNKTAAEWIDDFILRSVKTLLTTSTLTIQQLSDQFNFPNPSFFTQYFKRATGKTPKSFRNDYNRK